MSVNSNVSYLVHPNDEKTHIPSWIPDMYPVDYSTMLKMFDDTNTDFPYSNLDMLSLDGFSPDTIRSQLFQFLELKDGKNIQDRAIQKLNSIYDESIKYIERVLYRKIPAGLKSKKWNNVEEFMSAIELHAKRSTNGAYSMMFCVVLKVMVVEAGIYESPALSELDQDMSLLLNKIKSIPGLKLSKPKNGEGYLSYHLDDIYEGKLEHRPKSKDSARTKLIYNRQYPSINSFKDLLALRFELDPKLGGGGYVHTLLKIRNSLYGKNTKVRLEIKGGILGSEDIQNLEKENITVITKESKDSSSLQYEDAKFVGSKITIKTKTGKTKTLSPEIQFVLPGNKNESGFSGHDVYDFKKILSANARLFGGLTIGNIGYLLSQYKTKFHPEELLNHLLYPQALAGKPFLYLLKRKSTRTGKEQVYFTTADTYKRKDAKKLHSSNFSSIYKGYPEPLNSSHGATTDAVEGLVHSAIRRILRSSRPTP